MKKPKPILLLVKPSVRSAKEIVDLWEKEFPNYEIETIIADLEINVPQFAKGTLKVSMKERNKRKSRKNMKYLSSNWDISVCPFCDGYGFKVKEKMNPSQRLSFPEVELECENCGAKFNIRVASKPQKLVK